jgi:hypothetical protein
MKYVISSAQAFAEPNKEFLETLKNYATVNNAKLLILPMIGNSAKEDKKFENFHQEIRNLDLIMGDYKLNNNISIQNFEVRPYQVDPITGLQRFAQRGQSKIFASPKQRWQYIPHSNKKIPKALITTGAITLPNYATGDDVSAERRRLGNIAKLDHEYGAIFIEVEDDKIYHWRNLMSQANGKFSDLFKEYNGVKVNRVTPLAMVAGDWHNGYTNKKVRKATLEMITKSVPDNLMLHDFFDGHSISHHADKALISERIIEGKNKHNLDLELELKQAYNELIKIHNASPDTNIYLVQSNHLEFLNRWLDEGRFMQDNLNRKIGIELANLYAKGNNPVEVGIRMFGELPKKITFLNRWADFKVNGYQLASHGDIGPGGGRGNLASKEKDYGKSITGHVHKSEKLRQTFTVGCMLPLNMYYTKGSPVAWTNSNAFVYKTGVQIVNIIEGKYE